MSILEIEEGLVYDAVKDSTLFVSWRINVKQLDEALLNTILQALKQKSYLFAFVIPNKVVDRENESWQVLYEINHKTKTLSKLQNEQASFFMFRKN